MKFICGTKELSDALNIVCKAISGKANIPILEGIKMSAYGDEVTLMATDLELYIRTKIKADIKLEGETVVTGRIFADFMRKVSDDEVTVEKYSSTLSVNYGENVSEFQCMDDDAYPEPRAIGGENGFTAKDKELKEVIDGVIFCASQDDTRAILRGCKFSIEGDELVAVALDGFRLAVTRCRVFGVTGEPDVVIPAKNLQEIVKIIGEDDMDVRVTADKNQVLFDLGSTLITTRLLEGEFYQYRKIVPQSSPGTSVMVNKEALTTSLDRASLVAKNKKNYVKLSVSGNTISIDSASEQGKIHESVACSAVEGKDLDIAFNTRFLFDAFSRIKEDFIKLSFYSSTAPALILPKEGDKYLYLVLPVRLVG
ncbi:MAG TPA: DNA polymerase III subunit beta [Candidatus Stercoripulliclostridium merdigallinarum]|uniref:Beta sliding clamp n=1 Tax=Candidatus Stercoripulliclostridium merdigallinarum TaxID=2840951 RepID=A0A9D1MGG1_9FIRM|nr:DNA polymerase III subunit beta [Candidatus Stercoripulliclostridium merdigallinarum]